MGQSAEAFCGRGFAETFPFMTDGTTGDFIGKEALGGRKTAKSRKGLSPNGDRPRDSR